VSERSSTAKERVTEPRERIIEAAETLFARYGLDKTTLADIARRAHLSKATLYHHFPEGKESIFRVAVDNIIETCWQRLLTHVHEGATPQERLRRYISERIAIFDREIMVRGMAPEVWGNLKPWIEHALEGHLERERGLIQELLQGCMEAGAARPVDIDLTARLVQSIIQGLTVDGPLETTTVGRQQDTAAILEFIERGLAAR
jgi:AcrR family transcriptional regulator